MYAVTRYGEIIKLKKNQHGHYEDFRQDDEKDWIDLSIDPSNLEGYETWLLLCKTKNEALVTKRATDWIRNLVRYHFYLE